MGIIHRCISFEYLNVYSFVFLRLIDDLIVGNGRLTFWIPIDHAEAAIDETVVVHFLESRAHGEIALFVEGECFARPVDRSAHLAHLG